jgi:hypothetical protein
MLAVIATPTTTKELEQEKLMKDGILALSAIAGAVLLLKAVAASISVYLAMIPLLYIYGVNTCPPASSFDAKQQLRIVMRGDQLPENHPQKPNKGNILESFVASAKAVVASELATLPGYSIDITSLMGAALFATVTMPTADLECYWFGCNHHWYYWGSKNLSSENETNENNVAVPGVSSTHQGKNVYNKPPESTTNIKIGRTNIKFDFKEE